MLFSNTAFFLKSTEINICQENQKDDSDILLDSDLCSYSYR